MENNKISAFYQCYKQPKATIATIESFRKYYPDGDIFLISDGGYDFSGIAKHFNCNYIYMPRMGNDLGVISNNRQGIVKWLDRLLEVSKKIQGEYIMILEDDVRIFAPVFEVKYILNGINTEVRIGKKLTNFLKQNNALIPKSCNNYFFGGCGGSIIKKDFLVNNFKNIEETIEKMEPFLEEKLKNHFVSDYWLSVLILYFGGKIGQYRGFCETWYLSFYFRKNFLKNIKTLHFDKTLNNISLTKEDLYLLGWNSNTPDLIDYENQIKKSTSVKISKIKKIVILPKRIIRFINHKILGLLMQRYAKI